jgi:hypothetical protein
VTDCLLSAACRLCALSGHICCYAKEGDAVEKRFLLNDEDVTYLDLLDLGDHGLPFESHFYERWEDATTREPLIDWSEKSGALLSTSHIRFH